jgi:hypothetical protein
MPELVSAVKAPGAQRPFMALADAVALIGAASPKPKEKAHV